MLPQLDLLIMGMHITAFGFFVIVMLWLMGEAMPRRFQFSCSSDNTNALLVRFIIVKLTRHRITFRHKGWK